MERDVVMHISEISTHGRSKKEIYEILTMDANVYLPPIDQWNADFISDVISGEKQVQLK